MSWVYGKSWRKVSWKGGKGERIVRGQGWRVWKAVTWQGGKGGRMVKCQGGRFLVLFKSERLRVTPGFRLFVSDVDQQQKL